MSEIILKYSNSCMKQNKYYHWCYTAHLKFWHVLKEYSALRGKKTNTTNYSSLKAFLCFTEKTPALFTKKLQ